MRVTRCHLDQPLSVGTETELPAGIANHLLRVLRLGRGARVVLFNGNGHDYEAELIDVGKERARVAIHAQRELDNESPLQLALVQAVLRGEKMDLVLQKATELGVGAIIPVITEHGEVRLEAERGDRRHLHWQGVIASACGQSGRARLPRLARAMPLDIWLGSRPIDGLDADSHAPGQRLPIFHLDPAATLSPRTAKLGSGGCFVIGPEGGLGPRDLARLKAAGANGLRLGPRILRTETAGLALLAAIQVLHGDF